MVISDESQRVTTNSYSGGDLSIPIALYAGKNISVSNSQYFAGSSSSSGGDIGASTFTASIAHVNAVEDNGLGPVVPVFTQEQYGQILRLLNKENTDMPAVNQTSTNTLFSIGTKKKQWVVDSGATKHTTASLDKLFDIIALEQGDHTQVQFPNGTTTSISHTGSYNWEVIIDSEPDREGHNTTGMPIMVEDDSDNVRTQDNVEEPKIIPHVMPSVTRKSSRVVIKLAWHQDYVTATKKTFQQPHSLSNFASYQSISLEYKACLRLRICHGSPVATDMLNYNYSNCYLSKVRCSFNIFV
ncbi:hypothetical protein H5410_020655 [Solanum commersonii]|uniref:Uncharacterized protein n=1 Tax=Solanum commersonii TaxID=4109 RepID=A0A9J5ZEW5_SOLCO|nr:hypothetical protein H5410_020655 [Solanum commersonii]